MCTVTQSRSFASSSDGQSPIPTTVPPSVSPMHDVSTTPAPSYSTISGPVVALYTSTFFNQADLPSDLITIFSSTIEVGMVGLGLEHAKVNIITCSKEGYGKRYRRKTQEIAPEFSIEYEISNLDGIEVVHDLTDHLEKISENGSLLQGFIMNVSLGEFDTEEITANEISTIFVSVTAYTKSDDTISLALIVGISIGVFSLILLAIGITSYQCWRKVMEVPDPVAVYRRPSQKLIKNMGNLNARSGSNDSHIVEECSTRNSKRLIQSPTSLSNVIYSSVSNRTKSSRFNFRRGSDSLDPDIAEDTDIELSNYANERQTIQCSASIENGANLSPFIASSAVSETSTSFGDSHIETIRRAQMLLNLKIERSSMSPVQELEAVKKLKSEYSGKSDSFGRGMPILNEKEALSSEQKSFSNSDLSLQLKIPPNSSIPKEQDLMPTKEPNSPVAPLATVIRVPPPNSARRALWVQSIRELCDDLFELFEIFSNYSSTCAEVVRWSFEMKNILDVLDLKFEENPRLKVRIDPGPIEKIELFLEELVSKGHQQKLDGTMSEFLLSKKTAIHIDNVSKMFRQVLIPLNLGENLTVSLRGDENLGLLLCSLEAFHRSRSIFKEDQNQVKLSIFGSFIHKAEATLGGSLLSPQEQSRSPKTPRVQTLRGLPGGLSRSRAIALLRESNFSSLPIESGTGNGENEETGRVEGVPLREVRPGEVESTLERLQATPSEWRKDEDDLIGTGRFSKVYKAIWRGKITAVKVMLLEELKPDEVQTAYLRFAREAYMLSILRHHNIVPIYACTCTINAITLFMPYLWLGSLHDVLTAGDTWNDFRPSMRHQLLCDIAQGMNYLHLHNVYHRDLRSQNVLISDNCRALLSDFGLNKTSHALSANSSETMFSGGTVGWTSEMFGPRQGPRKKYPSPCDIFSYGIIIWEVLVAGCAPRDSNPRDWISSRTNYLVETIVQGKVPILPIWAESGENVQFGAQHSKIMQSCLVEDSRASERPLFNHIVNEQQQNWKIFRSG